MLQCKLIYSLQTVQSILFRMISRLLFLLFFIINFCYFLFNHIHDYCYHAVLRYAIGGFFQIYNFFPKQFCCFQLPLGKNLLFENFTQSFFIYLPECLGRFFLFFIFYPIAVYFSDWNWVGFSKQQNFTQYG